MAQKLTPGDNDLPLGHIFKPKEALIKSIVLELEGTDASDTSAMKKIIHRFWTTLKDLGDPIAQLVIDLNKGEGFSANSASVLLRHHLGDKYFRENPPKENEYTLLQDKGLQSFKVPTMGWRNKQNKQVEIWFREIQKRIAEEHWIAAKKDKKNIFGKLDRRQITDYHHKILVEMKLPKRAFGGTLFGGTADDLRNIALAELIWCQECDIVVEVKNENIS